MWGTSVLSYSLLFLLALSPLLVSYAYLVLTQYFHIIMCVCWFVSVAAAFYKVQTAAAGSAPAHATSAAS